MITILFTTATNPRGPGYWKLNTHLLTETGYVTLIRKTIADVSKDYEGQNEVDEILLWDVIKMEIRSASICYATSKKRRLKHKENLLDEEVSALEKTLDDRNISDNVRECMQTELRMKKQQVEDIIAYKTHGAILRSKVRWYNEGEKNTKYFHSMEKRHFNSKTIRNLKIETDKKISTDSEILDEAKKYYESLYMSITNSDDVDNCENIFFPEVNETKLSYNQKESCEGLLSEKECFESFKTVKPGKSPGTDGIPTESL